MSEGQLLPDSSVFALTALDYQAKPVRFLPTIPASDVRSEKSSGTAFVVRWFPNTKLLQGTRYDEKAVVAIWVNAYSPGGEREAETSLRSAQRAAENLRLLNTIAEAEAQRFASTHFDVAGHLDRLISGLRSERQYEEDESYLHEADAAISRISKGRRTNQERWINKLAKDLSNFTD